MGETNFTKPGVDLLSEKNGLKYQENGYNVTKKKAKMVLWPKLGQTGEVKYLFL